MRVSVLKVDHNTQSVSLSLKTPEFQRNREDFPASLDKLRQLIEDKVHVLQAPFTEEQQVKDQQSL